ncbi:MAG: peptidylprolyl isomerase [Planctomycetales bacterium]|nr:peptidylprolyl isomerase [Planctomycetales bacterium]
MPQLSSQSPAKIVAESRSNRSGILIGGTLVVLIAGGISMQVWRAQTTQAAEQKSDDGSTKTRMDAQNTAFARVNAEPISYEALAKECVERYGKEVLENMISRLIIQQECAERGVVVSEAEVTQQVIEISKKFGLAVDQYYKLLEAERGLSPTQYQRDIIWPMLALRKLAGKEVTITREMMQQAYEDNYGPRVKARMIVCDKQRRAQEVWDKAKAKPEDFDALARDYSVETNSRALGGVIPPIRKNTGAHENLRKAAFAMKEPGEISGILQIGPSQFAILKFEGQTEPVDHDPKDVQVQLQADLTEREVQKMVGDTFETLQKSARVDNFLTGESRGTVERASAIQETAPETPVTE